MPPWSSFRAGTGPPSTPAATSPVGDVRGTMLIGASLSVKTRPSVWVSPTSLGTGLGWGWRPSVNRAKAALIITPHRPRPLADCIRAIRPQVDDVLVIDNASDPKAHVPPEVWLEYIPDQPPHLARFWNHG